MTTHREKLLGAARAEPTCAYCKVQLDRFWWVDPETGQRFCSVYHLNGGRFRGAP